MLPAFPGRVWVTMRGRDPERDAAALRPTVNLTRGRRPAAREFPSSLPWYALHTREARPRE